mmetsp:Transcript_17613/g.45966  ORF Transcript_17613/g.45966 Transcript_17613/m.45966 type:complete len:131 (-) Transcript_17613:410-802(-)|eukprot:CAMPEP_0182522532 /NCGR_PEP_ID=MMETSP1323-20130603/383_1 /TAXON_ID=236787 /ORGANISM="Florenciella parvula, Strain RCC1693" /LENGTH=130 /DNA_ID=CAMNT_0024730695 /DNA_START=38 /DNA_END=430 /DNA_ORIENTATION=-
MALTRMMATRAVTALASRPAATGARMMVARGVTMDNDHEILSDYDQQGGRRKIELDEELQGVSTFSRDPIMPPIGAGSKTNPIEVPSGYSERVVGYECPEVHQLMWFTMTKGPLHYIPSIDKYFKLVDAM